MGFLKGVEDGFIAAQKTVLGLFTFPHRLIKRD